MRAIFAIIPLLGALALAPFPTDARPKPATGSNCDSSWVNNAGAMACFTQGEEESRAGVAHPHYVACLNGTIFCCVDKANGQHCEAQEARPATDADRVKALIGAHRAMTTRLGRYSTPADRPRETPAAAPRR